jgi:hypothetical protein
MAKYLMEVSFNKLGDKMGLRKLSMFLLIAVFFGCEAEKPAESKAPVVQKDMKAAQNTGSRASVSEPP